MPKKQKKQGLFETAVIEKRNILNELRSNNMSLPELRFFSIYLSKIDPRHESTRIVRFPVEDFRRIMGLGTDMNMTHFKGAVRSILQQIVEIPNEDGNGYKAFQLFKQADVAKGENDEWYVEFDAHDKALPLMFNFKREYFKYELWNALRLKSTNQIRMYEILKQYEGIGKRELPITELKELLGINKDEYADRWDNFKSRVLDSCQQALKEFTDICFTYERGKVGRGGKWKTIIFHIQKNKNHTDPLTLDEFIEKQPKSEPEPELAPIESITYSEEVEDEDEILLKKYEGDEKLRILAEGCNYEFDCDQMKLIRSILARNTRIPYDIATGDLTWGRQTYLQEKMHELNVRNNDSSKEPVKNRFRYFVKMLEEDTDDQY